MIKGNFDLTKFKGDKYHFKNDKFIVFKDRAIIKAESKEKAKMLILH